MGSRERKTKITSNRGMIREKREVLKKLEKNPKSVVDFLKKELKLSTQSTDENLQDEWANWRVGPEGGDIYKRGVGKKNLDYIDDLLKDPEFRSLLSNKEIDKLIDDAVDDSFTINPEPEKKKEDKKIEDDESETSGITITDIPNPPTMKIDPIDIDPSDPIGRRGKPSPKKVKVEIEKDSSFPRETTPEEEMSFQKGVAPTVESNVESTVESTTSEPKVSKPIDLSKQVSSKAMDISTPSTIDQIPESRLSSDNKSQDQLRSDINYFLKNFPTPLKNIKTQAKRLNTMGLVQLQRLHKRIVNILQPNKMATSGKKVGVVIDAEEYIKRKVGEVMIDNAIKGYQIPNLQPVGDNIDNKSDGTKDIGSYEIKVGPDGGLNSQKEPVYRYIPTTNEEGVNEIEYNYQSKRKPKRMSLPKTKMRNQVVTGKREVRTNPFLEKQGGHRLNVLL